MREHIKLALAFACALVFLLLIIGGRSARSGEAVECRAKPGGGNTLWLYRNMVDGKPENCWFKAEKGMSRGQDKPRSELYWAAPVDPAEVEIPNAPEMRAPWQLEERWPAQDRMRGGWDHFE